MQETMLLPTGELRPRPDMTEQRPQGVAKNGLTGPFDLHGDDFEGTYQQ